MRPVSIILVAVLLSIVAAFATVKMMTPHAQVIAQPEQQKKTSAFDRVMQTRTIRCGYVAYAPYLVKDANTGKLSGIFYDLTEKMAQLAGLKVDWVYETTFATFIADMQAGRYDVYCGGLWPEANKSLQIAYSMPVNFVGLGVYVRADDDRFTDNVAKLNNPDFKFAALDGEMSTIVAKEDFPQASLVSHPENTDISQLVMDVVTKKADAVIVERSVAYEYLLKHPGEIKNLTEDDPIRVFSNTWAALKGETELIATLNTVIDEMERTGAVDRIVRAYPGADQSFYPVAQPYDVAY